MKKARRRRDDMRAEYDLSNLGPIVRGKYYKRYRASVSVITLDPEVAAAFPDSASVNRALKGVLKARAARNAGRR